MQWERSSRPLAGPVVGGGRVAAVPAAAGAVGGRAGDSSANGRLEDLHAVYGGLGSGRLVIIGGPGSGKSGAAVLLVLAALKHRAQMPEPDRQLVPVPVLFTLHGWDPEHSAD